ncbi:MAG TPA: hypothetical protein VHE81_04700 [Lacipirellulaceae bacterium]|nr:hypothetical protein [Lacipirellulaceae bacterium]
MNGMNVLCVLILAACVAFVARSNALAQNSAPAAQSTSKVQSEKNAKEHSPFRQKLEEWNADATTTDFCHCIGDNSAADARIERVLRAPLNSTGLNFAATPLQDVVTQISADYGIPILLDKPALDEAAIGTDLQIDANMQHISLRSALRLMLEAHQLTFIIRDEVLLITTKEVAEKNLILCVYDARKVLPDANNKSIDALIDTIMSCIATDTWSENGGSEADIRSIPPGLLVITQTPAVHEQIRGLLATIQKMTQNHPTTPTR